MSIATLIHPNNNDIYCDQLTCNELILDSRSYNENLYKACIRCSVDTTSNPDPETFGLLVPAQFANQFVVPLTSTPNPDLGIMSPFLDDPYNVYDLINGNTIRINVVGVYRVSFEFSSLDSVSASKIVQIIPPSSIILQTPNIGSAIANSFNHINIVFPSYDKAYVLSSTNIMNVTSDMLPVSLQLVCVLNNFSNVSITLNTNLSIQKIM